jgi:hypothetical protein
MDHYFATLGPDAPIKSFAELVAAKTSAVQRTLEAELAVVDGMNSAPYKDRMLNRDKLRLAIAAKMADLNLDAILYPLQRILVAPVTAEDQLERNGTLSSGTGFPAVTFPGGSPPLPHRRRSACQLAPNCWASTTPKPDSSPLPTLSNRQAGFANRRNAHHRFPTSHSGNPRGGVGTVRPHGARACWPTIGLSGEMIDRKIRTLAAATHRLSSRLEVSSGYVGITGQEPE